MHFILLASLGIIVLPVQGQTAPQLLERGREALRVGVPRFDNDLLLEAADAFRRALARNPRYAEARVSLAEALLWLGDFSQATEEIARARELRYSSIELDLLDARLNVLKGEIGTARNLYRQVLQQQPYNADAQVGNAILALADGMSENALNRLRLLENRFPENRQLLTALVEVSYTRDDVESAERYMNTALQYHGDAPAIQLFAARWALEQGEWARAEYHARNAVTLAPGVEEGWLLLAHAAYRQGRDAEARTHYEQLITLKPDNHHAWYARGVLAARTGDTDTAYTSWSRAVRIRPDYELARIARENTLIEGEALDSPLRAEAAERYRRSGKELEDRFLHRQAERHYRRGLQINPFDTVLRRNLADLYLAQDLRARYLQELEIIAEMRSDDRELEERIETFRAIRRDSPAVMWNVDQFTAPRYRTSIALYYAQEPHTFEPDASRHLAEYLASLLRTSQNISIVEILPAGIDPINLLARARERDADLALLVRVGLPNHQVRITAELLDRRTTGTLYARTFLREGIDKVERAVRDLAGDVIAQVPVTGRVLERRFQHVLVSVGAVDDLTLDDSVELQSTPGGEPIGTGVVTAVDDLVAVIEYEPLGPDRLTTEHFVQLVEEEPPPTDSDIHEQTSRIDELLQQVFRLP